MIAIDLFLFIFSGKIYVKKLEYLLLWFAELTSAIQSKIGSGSGPGSTNPMTSFRSTESRIPQAYPDSLGRAL